MPEPYELIINDEAQDNLAQLDKTEGERIIKKMRWVALNAAIIDHYAMTGNWAGHYRYKIGDYRAVYDLDHEAKTVTVIAIGHRKNVYD